MASFQFLPQHFDKHSQSIDSPQGQRLFESSIVHLFYDLNSTSMDHPSKKRKITPPLSEDLSTNSQHVAGKSANNSEIHSLDKHEESASKSDSEVTDQIVTSANDASRTTESRSSTAAADRLAKFAALKNRATASARSNLAETKAEANRAAIDPTVLASLSRRSAIASHNLLKADTEEDGGKGAFERKRAWDYTIEESEKWDERVQKKKNARDNNSFADYSAEAGKIYDRQIRDLERAAAKDGGKNREDYERQKMKILENAARNGGLEVVEMESGEMVAIDRDGRFYADSEDTGFVEQKPNKENVDRLVEDLRKADEIRMKKRHERGREADEGDVTYINDKNKQFNMKLARFYDRYTTDIRESFERGTAI